MFKVTNLVRSCGESHNFSLDILLGEDELKASLWVLEARSISVRKKKEDQVRALLCGFSQKNDFVAGLLNFDPLLCFCLLDLESEVG